MVSLVDWVPQLAMRGMFLTGDRVKCFPCCGIDGHRLLMGEVNFVSIAAVCTIPVMPAWARRMACRSVVGMSTSSLESKKATVGT
jgi:hypothetical protein